MPDTKRETLYGWGHYPVRQCLSWRPEKHRDLEHIVRNHPNPVLARGMGRSYGDAALQPDSIIHTTRLDHFLQFDPAQGIVRAQAGVTLADLMELTVTRGWLPPVIPGTRYVTLGGAFACNIHGKNHYRDGEFAEHVLAIKLMLANGETLTCSPSEHSDVFWATAGGMGMTGIIEEITLKLKPIASSSLRTTTYQVDSLDDMIAAFEHYRNTADYMVGWIDHMAKGENIGRGIFEAANHITAQDGGAYLSEAKPFKTRFSIPCFMPSFLLNRYLMAFYNKWRFKKYSHERLTEISDFNGFFHPLDAINGWNRLYGKRGFFQYQCLLPETPDIVARLHTFLSSLHQKKIFSFLAVIKYHRESKGFLTFSKRGYSLALDFPNTHRVRHVLPQLDRWVADQGGRVYLAKDALLTPELFYKMYGQHAHEWQALLHDLDINAKFTSLMSDRLQWKQGLP